MPYIKLIPVVDASNKENIKWAAARIAKGLGFRNRGVPSPSIRVALEEDRASERRDAFVAKIVNPVLNAHYAALENHDFTRQQYMLGRISPVISDLHRASGPDVSVRINSKRIGLHHIICVKPDPRPGLGLHVLQLYSHYLQLATSVMNIQYCGPGPLSAKPAQSIAAQPS